MTERQGQIAARHLRGQAAILRAAVLQAGPVVAPLLAEKADAYDATATLIEGIAAPGDGARYGGHDEMEGGA